MLGEGILFMETENPTMANDLDDISHYQGKFSNFNFLIMNLNRDTYKKTKKVFMELPTNGLFVNLRTF